jgi:nucleoside-diphosphate-sugar epimerase
VKVVVFGATGVVGRAAVEHFARVADCVVAVSRRPVQVPNVEHVSVDLSADDPAPTLAHPSFAGATHVVYAALQESSDLVAGWRDRELMDLNLRMFRNAMVPLLDSCGSSMQHVSLLQGAKAYGLHVGREPVPARERAERVDHDNFYFLQEDALREFAVGGGWSWTILRPQVVFGESFGSPMNLLPAIGVFAAIEREKGRPLRFPGGGRGVSEAVDARLLAQVLAWAAEAPAARNETFNVTNGDVFDWHQVWPAIADALAVELGEPEPQRLADTMPPRAAEWERVVARYALRSPSDMASFVGSAWQYADVLFGSLAGPRRVPALLSTIKIRQAGFGDCIDTEDMFRQWFSLLRQRRLLP